MKYLKLLSAILLLFILISIPIIVDFSPRYRKDTTIENDGKVYCAIHNEKMVSKFRIASKWVVRARAHSLEYVEACRNSFPNTYTHVNYYPEGIKRIFRVLY